MKLTSKAFCCLVVWNCDPVKHYLIVAGVILLVIILKRYISGYLAGLLFKLVNRIWKDVDKKSFTNLLIQPLGFFLLILIAIISLHKLNFPNDLNVEIYGYTLKEIIHASATLVLIVSGCCSALLILLRQFLKRRPTLHLINQIISWLFFSVIFLK